MRVVRPHLGEFVSAAFNFTQLILDHPVAPRGRVLIAGFIDRESLQKRAFQHGELIMSLIAAVQLSIQRDIGQSRRYYGFCTIRDKGQYRPVYRRTVGIDEQDQVRHPISVQIVHHGLRYSPPDGKIHALIGGTLETDGPDTHLVLSNLLVAAIDPVPGLADFHRRIDLFEFYLGPDSTQAKHPREQKNELSVHGIKIGITKQMACRWPGWVPKTTAGRPPSYKHNLRASLRTPHRWLPSARR